MCNFRVSKHRPTDETRDDVTNRVESGYASDYNRNGSAGSQRDTPSRVDSAISTRDGSASSQRGGSASSQKGGSASSQRGGSGNTRSDRKGSGGTTGRTGSAGKSGTNPSPFFLYLL